MEIKRKENHGWFSQHAHDILEVIGNIAAVAVLVGITYLILRYLIKYG